MNDQVVDFLKNTSNQNLVAAKENIHAALAAKMADALAARETQIRDSLYNQTKEND